MNKNFAAIVSLFLASIPLSGLATEGAFEINQACVADGCFPGDAAGFPVTIASRGNYQLTSNLELENASDSAIRVNSDNVNIDLKGFAIFGPNACTGSLADCTFTDEGGGSGIHSSAGLRNIRVRYESDVICIHSDFLRIQKGRRIFCINSPPV